ncbi:hypothetical protein PENTCL1PPCAC_12226, partial [Pristionchus entomophagus]
RAVFPSLLSPLRTRHVRTRLRQGRWRRSSALSRPVGYAGRSGTLHVLRRLHHIGLWGPPLGHYHRALVLSTRRIVHAVLLPRETPQVHELRHDERQSQLACSSCSK